MHAQTNSAPAEKQIISGFGLGAGAILVLGLAVLAAVIYSVGIDKASWAAASGGERLLAFAAGGVVSGSLFAMVADLVRQAMR